MKDNMKKWPIFLIPASLLLFTGCSNDVSKDTNQASNQIQQKTQEAAGQIQNKTVQLSNEVQKETPGMVQNMKNAYQTGKQQVQQALFQKGDQAIVKKDVYMAMSPETYDELYQLIRVDNLNGVTKAVQNDQVLKIKAGTKVKVLERDLLRTKIETMDSKRTGYLPATVLEKTNGK